MADPEVCPLLTGGGICKLRAENVKFGAYSVAIMHVFCWV